MQNGALLNSFSKYKNIKIKFIYMETKGTFYTETHTNNHVQNNSSEIFDANAAFASFEVRA